MRPKHADGVANCVDPDQTDPSGSRLFAYTCLSESFESLRVMFFFYVHRRVQWEVLLCFKDLTTCVSNNLDNLQFV